jgi:hypothetical protein
MYLVVPNEGKAYVVDRSESPICELKGDRKEARVFKIRGESITITEVVHVEQERIVETGH